MKIEKFIFILIFYLIFLFLICETTNEEKHEGNSLRKRKKQMDENEKGKQQIVGQGKNEDTQNVEKILKKSGLGGGSQTNNAGNEGGSELAINESNISGINPHFENASGVGVHMKSAVPYLPLNESQKNANPNLPIKPKAHRPNAHLFQRIALQNSLRHLPEQIPKFHQNPPNSPVPFPPHYQQMHLHRQKQPIIKIGETKQFEIAKKEKGKQEIKSAEKGKGKAIEEEIGLEKTRTVIVEEGTQFRKNDFKNMQIKIKMDLSECREGENLLRRKPVPNSNRHELPLVLGKLCGPKDGNADYWEWREGMQEMVWTYGQVAAIGLPKKWAREMKMGMTNDGGNVKNGQIRGEKHFVGGNIYRLKIIGISEKFIPDVFSDAFEFVNAEEIVIFKLECPGGLMGGMVGRIWKSNLLEINAHLMGGEPLVEFPHGELLPFSLAIQRGMAGGRLLTPTELDKPVIAKFMENLKERREELIGLWDGEKEENDHANDEEFVEKLMNLEGWKGDFVHNYQETHSSLVAQPQIKKKP